MSSVCFVCMDVLLANAWTIWWTLFYLSAYGSTLCCTLAAFSVSWSFTQSVGLLRRGIGPSQGRHLHTGQHKHRINTYRHPCLKWDSNPQSQCFRGRRQSMTQNCAVTVIGCRSCTLRNWRADINTANNTAECKQRPNFVGRKDKKLDVPS
jgi:hypothetical protein